MMKLKPIGWRYESHRHSLAAKGVRTGHQGYFLRTRGSRGQAVGMGIVDPDVAKAEAERLKGHTGMTPVKVPTPQEQQKALMEGVKRKDVLYVTPEGVIGGPGVGASGGREVAKGVHLPVQAPEVEGRVSPKAYTEAGEVELDSVRTEPIIHYQTRGTEINLALKQFGDLIGIRDMSETEVLEREVELANRHADFLRRKAGGRLKPGEEDPIEVVRSLVDEYGVHAEGRDVPGLKVASRDAMAGVRRRLLELTEPVGVGALSVPPKEAVQNVLAERQRRMRQLESKIARKQREERGESEDWPTGEQKDYTGKRDDEDEMLARKRYEVIRKLPGQRKFRLYSEEAGRNLGTFPSRAAAVKHEREVQWFRRRK